MPPASLTPTPIQTQASVPQTPLCHALVFTIQRYAFALPLGAIVRIIQGRSPQISPDLPIGLFEGEPLPMVDLQAVLSQPSRAIQATEVHDASVSDHQSEFLIIVQLMPQQWCGITVDHLPTVQPLSLNQTYLIPEFYQHKIAHLASHAIVCEDDLIIFLLDLKTHLGL